MKVQPRPEPGWEIAMDQLVPEHLQEALRDWVLHAYMPGSFLCAVLDDQLHEAVSRADGVSMAGLRGVLTWLYNFAPSACWGSRAKRMKWAEWAEVRAGEIAAQIVQHESTQGG